MLCEGLIEKYPTAKIFFFTRWNCKNFAGSDATVEELAQMGIECEPIRLDSYTKKKMTFFFDPDGLPLELHE